jgi:hypothetical protein
MWIFTRYGFLSIVQHNDYQNILIVRSRFKGHIQRIFGDVEVENDAGTDYEYRTEIPKEKVAKIISDLIADIDYGNFKNELGVKVRDRLQQLDKTYASRCWATYEVMSGNYEG